MRKYIVCYMNNKDRLSAESILFETFDAAKAYVNKEHAKINPAAYDSAGFWRHIICEAVYFVEGQVTIKREVETREGQL